MSTTTLLRSSIAVGVLLAAAAQAQALTFTASAPLPLAYSAPSFTTADMTTAYTATNSVVNVRATPTGAASYLVVSKGGSATVGLGGAFSSYSFLWGSPDVFNSVSFVTSTGIETYTGIDLASLTGSPSNGFGSTTYFTAFGTPGQTISSVTFASSGIAFEVAVAPVPEPSAYALMLAGLGAIGFVARRRRS